MYPTSTCVSQAHNSSGMVAGVDTPTTPSAAVANQPDIMAGRCREQNSHVLHALFHGMKLRSKKKTNTSDDEQVIPGPFNSQVHRLAPNGLDDESRPVFSVVDKRLARTAKRNEPIVVFALANPEDYTLEFTKATHGRKNNKTLPVPGQNLLRRPTYEDSESAPIMVRKGIKKACLYGDPAAGDYLAPRLERRTTKTIPSTGHWRFRGRSERHDYDEARIEAARPQPGHGQDDLG